MTYQTPGASDPSPLSEAMQAALEALEGHLSGELWIAMAGYRKRHPGGTLEQCRGELLGSGAIAAEWGIPERTWRQAWAWLEAGQPGPAPPSDARGGD